MARTSVRYDGGSDGSNITNANSGFTTGSTTNSSTWVYDDTPVNPFTGGTCGRSTAGSGVTVVAILEKAGVNSACSLDSFQVPSSAPTSSVCDIMQLRGDIQHSGFRLHTDGSLRLLRLGAEVGVSARIDNFITTYAGQTVIAQQVVIQGTTTANGRQLAAVWTTSDLVTPIWSYDSGASVNIGVNGTNQLTNSRRGKLTSSAVPGNLVFFASDYDDGATAFMSNPALDSLDPSGTISRRTAYEYDFTTYENTTSVAAEVISGPNLDITVVGEKVYVYDTESRSEEVEVEFTVTGAGGSIIQTDMIPTGGIGTGSTIIEEVIYNGTEWAD